MYWGVLYGVAGLFAVVLAGFIFSIVKSSLPAWRSEGLSLIFGTTWDVSKDQYGALPLIVGTLETTAIALVLAVPIGIGTAVTIVHFLPRRLSVPLSSLVEVLAAIPSVVYGLWGIFVLVPWFSNTVQPFLTSLFGGHFPFQAAPEGYSVLLAGFVLFVMVLPLQVAFARDAIALVPGNLLEGALSLGATRWQVIRKVVLPSAGAGIVGATTLATARALGETIAVTMVIGNNADYPTSLNSTGATLAETIASGFDNATSRELAALFGIAVILMCITASVNWAGRVLVRRTAGVGGNP